FIRRDIGKDSKKTLGVEGFVAALPGVLDEIHDNLFKKAQDFRDARIHDVKDLKGVEEFYKKGGTGFVRLDYKLLEGPAFEKLKTEYSLTTRCLPLNDKEKILIAKAY